MLALVSIDFGTWIAGKTDLLHRRNRPTLLVLASFALGIIAIVALLIARARGYN